MSADPSCDYITRIDMRQKRDIANAARPVQRTHGVYPILTFFHFPDYGLFAISPFNPPLAINPPRSALTL